MTHPDNATHDGPAWSATQEWLADLDRDPDDTGYGNESDYTPEDYDPSDEPDYDDPDDEGDGSAPTPDPEGIEDYELAPSPGTESDSDDEVVPIADDADIYDTGSGQDATGSAKTADAPAPRFNKPLAIGFVAFVAVTTIAVTSVLLGMKNGPEVESEQSEAVTKITAAPAEPPPPPPGAGGGPTGIPFTASAPGCLPGSTAAQAVASGDPTQAWVCVRGGVDGQVLTIELGRTMVVTAIRITPGWVGTDASGADQWLQHRVVSRVSWILTDHGNKPTVVPQRTGNVHGEAPQPMPGQGVLASTITMIVQETSRPPADAPPADQGPAAPGPGGLLDDVLGAPLGTPPESSTATLPSLPGMPGGQVETDPVDNTFAVSSITVEGHQPIPS
ncbi:hypothetical protein A5731_18495 [Mycolicibacterium conceptionense]|uniref:hypothetical protein n=1 Tax=Mycolicibacterium conceptionense TaxID=451644 RepID=UPI0007E9E32A|nr:hypothetical protein [Mycolicibacterium conceptionense]OBB05362.1 hypothetical protein A5718_22795 [Mycolicibacterium conceptionense]OBF01265.1 hypothetical protein A5731_18495 [Mycolicibacterium conceptionense]